MNKFFKQIFICKPYDVGKNQKSLALVIPSVLVKRYSFSSSSTLFSIEMKEETNELILKRIEYGKNKEASIELQLPNHQSIDV